MKTPNFRRHRVAAAVAGAVLALGATQALATGFQLNEQSASSIGNAFAGGAAFTDDISAMWWNPAVLSKFERRQFVQGLHVVVPKIEFSNDGSVPALNQPLGGNGGDAGGWNFIPNLYVSMPINDQFAFGLGVNGPFGNKTQYSDGWLGRYQALDSKIITINVNPAFSWKVTPEFSVGAGVNFQYIDGRFTNNANYSAALISAATVAGLPAATVGQVAQATPGLDSEVVITGDDTAWGWNIGVAWDVTPAWRLAAAYRSEIKYSLKGNADFNHPTVSAPPQLAPVINALTNAINNPCVNPVGCRALYPRSVTSDITLPQIANLSAVWRVNPQWEVMADGQWTGWSSITDLTFVPTDGSTLPGVPLEWDDTWKIAVGTSYRYNEQWKARFGVAFDQTPVTTHPTARLPDSDRWWLTVGGEYRWTRDWKFDAGLVYIKGDSAEFDQRFTGLEAASLGQIRGSYDASVWILSAQAVYSF